MLHCFHLCFPKLSSDKCWSHKFLLPHSSDWATCVVSSLVSTCSTDCQAADNQPICSLNAALCSNVPSFCLENMRRQMKGHTFSLDEMCMFWVPYLNTPQAFWEYLSSIRKQHLFRTGADSLWPQLAVQAGNSAPNLENLNCSNKI